MLIISDRDDVNWGIFIMNNENRTRRSIYTREVDYPEVAPKELTITSFDGDFTLKVGIDGELYTYPVNKRGIFI